VLRWLNPKPKKQATQVTQLQRVCAWCGRVYEHDRWQKKPLKDDCPTTHGICPDCYAVVMSKLDPRD
jgi:hypothetical protein